MAAGPTQKPTHAWSHPLKMQMQLAAASTVEINRPLGYEPKLPHAMRHRHNELTTALVILPTCLSSICLFFVMSSVMATLRLAAR